MTVAVDTRFTKAYHQFIYQCFKITTSKHPKHTFIFISDKHLEFSTDISENIIFEIVKQSKISLFSQLKVASLLKKHKVDVFVTGELLNIKIPQCLIVLDRAKFKSLKRANVIVTNSEFSKKQITGKYNIDETKIDVVYEGVNGLFQPISPDQKEQVKEGYAEGYEYFLSTVSSNADILSLLKAFSVFKKRQKSNMQLVAAFPKEKNAEFTETLRLYRFKSEVKFLNADTKELALVTAASYAFVSPVSSYQDVLNAMRAGVPALVCNKKTMEEICRDAAVYFNINDHKDIADKMMLIFKDENLRQQLIEKGKERVKEFSWDNSAEQLWKSIQKAAN